MKPIFLTSISQQQANLRWEISGFSLFSFCQNERFFSFLSLHIFDESEFIFQFLNDKMHNYVKHTVNFIIQKLKHKHIFLIEYTNWESWGTSWQENLAFSVCILFEENVFIFQFLNDKIHSYVLFDIIVHFIIQKLKNKHTF